MMIITGSKGRSCEDLRQTPLPERKIITTSRPLRRKVNLRRRPSPLLVTLFVLASTSVRRQKGSELTDPGSGVEGIMTMANQY